MHCPPNRFRIGPRTRGLLPLALSLLASACGGSGEEPASSSGAVSGGAGSEGTGSPASEAAVAGGDQERPPRPQRNFTDRRVLPGAFYPALLERTNAARDGWLSETVAEGIEEALRTTLESVLRGDSSGLGRLLWREFEGAQPLRPASLGSQEHGPFLVTRGLELPAGGEDREIRGADFPGAVAELVAPLLGGSDPRVQVHVTGILPEPRSTELPYEILATLRLASGVGEGVSQINTTWRMGWSLGAKGKRIGIRWLDVESFEQISTEELPLVELTGHVLGGAIPEEELMAGALEFWKRVDRVAVVPSVNLGMHGLGVGDVDGDGREDAYVAQHSGLPNRLLLAGPDGRFRDEAAARGVDLLDDTTGVLICDLDGDGARDLALGAGSKVALYWNDGTGHFVERSLLSLSGTEQVYSISAADADGDGDLDLYATRYVAGGVIGGVPTPYHDARNGASNAYFRCEGPREYVDGTTEAGLDADNTRFSLASLWEDIDGDGDLDLYVANDFGRNNLFRNDGGTFVDIASERGAEDMAAGMGLSVADTDLDGDLDIYVSNMFTGAGSRITAQPAFLADHPLEDRAAYGMHTRGNTLLLRDGQRFEDATDEAGVGPGGWAWGAMFADLQNDGLPDILVPNGFLTGRKEFDLESFFWRSVVGQTPRSFPPTEAYRDAWVAISSMTRREGFSWNGPESNYAYLNVGSGRFVDASAAAGFDHEDDSRVACILDHDGDGRLDVLLRNRTGPRLRFLHGRGERGHWSSILLTGDAPNTDAIGALVTVKAGGTSYALRRYAGEGYLGCSSGRLHFGLGSAEEIESVSVRWPDGTTQEFAGVPIDRRVMLRKGSSSAVALEPVPSALLEVAPEPIPAGPKPSRVRVPLLDNLPMAPLVLPDLDGGQLRLEDALPDRVLVVLWAAYDEESERALSGLAAAEPELEEAGVLLHPLTLDQRADLDLTRAALERTGIGRRGGRLDRRERAILEGFLVEVLAGYEDLPLPLGILFDSEGAASVVYVGGLDPAAVAEDAAALVVDRESAGWRWPTQLTGGVWLEDGPSRSFGPFSSFLRGAGFGELAEEVARAGRERGEE